MTARWPQGWVRVRVGAEVARRGRLRGALVLLGCGPPKPLVDREDRLGSLAHELRVTARACRQVHGRVIASLGEPHHGSPDAGAEVGICDGLVTDREGVALTVWTADCVPLLLAGGGVVAAVHAGWKGVAAGIAAAAVRRFEVEYGVPPGQLGAVLGPAVGPCHYPVGEDVVAALTHAVSGARDWLRDGRVDLRGVLERQLEACGVSEVHHVGPCTSCDPELASYRRDGSEAGRQWSLICLGL